MMKPTGEWRTARQLSWIGLAGVGTFGAFLVASIALARAMRNPALRDRIRGFNRRRLNPLTLRIAGNRTRIYAALEHTGRRSGRVYTTPVVAKPCGDDFVIPLPYGAGTDWCRNVLAAGTYALTWNSQRYELERPEVISQGTAVRAFPWVQRVIFKMGGITDCLVMHRASATQAALPSVEPNAAQTLGSPGH
ncbi:MAG: hypothetical protein ACXVCX_07205 [Ktedonobacterales bacterium]